MKFGSGDFGQSGGEKRSRSSVWWALLCVLALALVLGFSLYRQVSFIDEPVDYANDEMQFKYGSIGSEAGQGLPYWMFVSLPDVCPDLLPGGWASLGVVTEPGMNRPIGFSQRRVGPLDMVAPNCAICHTGAVRMKDSASGETVRRAYLTAPAHQLDLMAYFQFVFDCIGDPRFNGSNVIAAIEKHTDLSLLEKLVHRLAVRAARRDVAAQAPKFESIIANRPEWGRGRVDTFNPYKVLIFDQDMTNDHSIGTADFMSIWNQEPREGIWLHWDGNNDSVDERNWSAAMGAGATPESIDLERIQRIRSWILTRRPPAYPFAVRYDLAARGQELYAENCSYCHDPGAPAFGKVTAIEALGTDAERVVSFDDRMAAQMNTIGEGKPWKFHRFRPTEGYANQPLDGLWLRAPYLHNGSVPTLRDLLEPAAERPAVFYRGNEHYDTVRVGFRSDGPEVDGQVLSEFDSRLRGNGNGGHEYGVYLSDEEKEALVEYLKIHGEPVEETADPSLAERYWTLVEENS